MTGGVNNLRPFPDLRVARALMQFDIAKCVFNYSTRANESRESKRNTGNWLSVRRT